MGVVFYSMAAIVSAFLFLPRSAGEPLRNIPLLLTLLSILVLLYIIRFIQYIVLMYKTRRYFSSKGYKIKKITVIPPFLFYKGNFSFRMKSEENEVYIRFLVRKNWYLHYHFDSIDKIEFYKYTRGFFYGGTKKFVAPISKTVSRNKNGSQLINMSKIKCDHSLIIFNKMPDYVTDSIKKEGLGNGDYICNTVVLLYDVKHLIESNVPFFAG